MTEHENFIAGRWVEPETGDWMENRNPATGEVIGLYPRSAAKDISMATAAADEARFASPHGVAVSPSGVIAVAEAENHTIRLMTPSADRQEGARPEYEVSTLAGRAGEDGMRDGLVDEALFRSPHAVAWTGQQELFLADIGNARIRIVDSGVVRTVAGSGAEGREDGQGELASLHYPMDIALADGGFEDLERGTVQGFGLGIALTSVVEPG